MIFLTFSDFFGPFFDFALWLFEDFLPMGYQQYIRPNHGIPGSHSWDGKPSTCRCCMTGKFSGCPRQMFLSRGPINKVFRRRNMDCLSYVRLSEPFFYCVAEIMFLSQAKLSEFKNIVFLSGQQAINISATTN